MMGRKLVLTVSLILLCSFTEAYSSKPNPLGCTQACIDAGDNCKEKCKDNAVCWGLCLDGILVGTPLCGACTFFNCKNPWDCQINPG